MTTVEQLRERRGPGAVLERVDGLSPLLSQSRARFTLPTYGLFLMADARRQHHLGCWSFTNDDWVLIANDNGTGYAVNRARTNPFNAQGNT